MTDSSKKNWRVFATATAATLAAAALWLGKAGLDDNTVGATLRHSAQLAFALYVVILIARPLQQLLNTNWTKALRRNRRLIGIAFAAVMTAHLLLIGLRVILSPSMSLSLTTLIGGGGAYAMIYLMFITSFDGPTRALGPRAWKRLHLVGLVWIGAIFAAPRSVAELTDPGYLKFGIPVLLAIALRVAARTKSSG